MTDVELLDSINRILKGSLVVLAGNLIGTGAGFLTRIFAARYLGAADYGTIALGVTVLNVVVLVALLGLNHGLATKIPESDSPLELFYSALVGSVAVSIALAAVLVVFAGVIAESLNNVQFEAILVVFAVGIPILTYNRIVIGVFRGFQLTRPRVLIKNFGFQGTTLVGVIVGAWIGTNTFGIALSWLGGTLAGALFATALWYRNNELRLTELQSLVPERVVPLVAFSLPLMISDAVWILLQQGDVLLLGYFTTSADIGVYDATYTLGRILLIFLGTVGFIFLPVISDRSDSRDDERLYRLTTKWTTFVALPLFLVLLFFPEFIMSTVFGESYNRGALILPLLAVGFFTHLLVGQAGNALITGGYTKQIMYVNTAGVLFNLAANVVLIPELNILGATIATVVSYVFVNAVYVYYLVRKVQIQPFYRNYLYPLAASTVVFALLVWTVDGVADVDSRLLFAGTVALYGLLYLPLLYLSGGIEAEDRAVIDQLL